MDHMEQNERARILARLTDVAHKTLWIQEEASAHPVNWDDEAIAHEIGHLRRMLESLHEEACAFACGDHPSDPPPSQVPHDGKTKHVRPPRVGNNARRLELTEGVWWWLVEGRDHRDNYGNDERRVKIWWPSGSVESAHIKLFNDVHYGGVTPSKVREYIEKNLV